MAARTAMEMAMTGPDGRGVRAEEAVRHGGGGDVRPCCRSFLLFACGWDDTGGVWGVGGGQK